MREKRREKGEGFKTLRIIEELVPGGVEMCVREKRERERERDSNGGCLLIYWAGLFLLVPPGELGALICLGELELEPKCNIEFPFE